MKLCKVDINDLISPDYNPRTITSEAFDSLKESLEEFGYINPIIVNEVNYNIISGNQRFKALKELGYTDVDVIMIEEPDLDREKLTNVRLNNHAGDWDVGMVDDLFKDLDLKGYDLKLTGFDTDSLKVFDVGSVELDGGSDIVLDDKSSNKDNSSKEDDVVDLEGRVESKSITRSVREAAFQVIINCVDEEEQKLVYNRLVGEGLDCSL